MNRIAITLSPKGEIETIASDAPVEVLIVDPSRPADRVYRYGAALIGPQHVQAQVGGYAVGHSADGRLGEGDGTGRAQPSRPALTVVSPDDDLPEIRRENALRMATIPHVAIFAAPDGLWGVVDALHEDGSVGPDTFYPLARLACARVLQLLGVGPVSPQTHPERVELTLPND